VQRNTTAGVGSEEKRLGERGLEEARNHRAIRGYSLAAGRRTSYTVEEARLTWKTTGGNQPSGPVMGRPKPECVAANAVADVETVTDDRKEHRVSAVEEFAVLDGLHGERGRELQGPSAVPARPVAGFRLGGGGVGHGSHDNIARRRRRVPARRPSTLPGAT
jgi:hypothetical protein